MIASEDPSTPLLQVLLSISTGIIKDSYHHLGWNMGQLPDKKKRTAAAEIVQKWGESIWIIVVDVLNIVKMQSSVTLGKFT